MHVVWEKFKTKKVNFTLLKRFYPKMFKGGENLSSATSQLQ